MKQVDSKINAGRVRIKENPRNVIRYC